MDDDGPLWVEVAPGVTSWRTRERKRNSGDKDGSRRSRGGLTVIYVAVGSLASCLIKVVSLDRGRTAKLLTRKFSQQSPRFLPHSTSALAVFSLPSASIVGASVRLSVQANDPSTKTTEVFETRYPSG